MAFFIANAKGGIFWGTGVFMAATAVALAVSWALTRKLAMVPLIGAGFVAVFGGLTLWLHDDTFIKVKVTLINASVRRDSAWRAVFRQAVPQAGHRRGDAMDDEGWRKLTLRWGLFFFALARLNEIVWRT